MKKALVTAALFAFSFTANAVPLTLISHQWMPYGGITVDYVPDGSHASGLVPASTAIWNWDGTTITSTGQYSALLPGAMTSAFFAHQVTDLSIDTTAVDATATSYQCIEGDLGASQYMNWCGQYDFGFNGVDESSTTWGPGVAVSQTLGGDDASNGSPISIEFFDLILDSVTGTGMNPGDTITLSNGVPWGTAGAERMIFEVQTEFSVDVSFSWGVGGNGASTLPLGQSIGWAHQSPNTLGSISNDTYFTAETGHNQTLYFNADFAQGIDYPVPGSEQCATLLPGATSIDLQKYACVHDTPTITTIPTPVIDEGPGALAAGTLTVTGNTLFGTLQVTQTTDEPTGGTTQVDGNGVNIGTSAGDGSDGYNVRFSDGSPHVNGWYGVSQNATLTVNLTGNFTGTDWSVTGGTVRFSDPDFVCQQASPDILPGELCEPTVNDGGFAADGSHLSWGTDADGAGPGTLSQIDVRDGSSSLISTLSGVLANLTIDTSGNLTTNSGEYRRARTDDGGGCPTEIIYDTNQLTCGELNTGPLAITGTVLGFDITPNAFAFVDQVDVGWSATVTSAPVTITGITASAPVSVTGGEYSIDCTGTFTSDPGVIYDGQTLCVRHVSAATELISTDTVIDVGPVSDTFTTTTMAEDADPDAFDFTDQFDVEQSEWGGGSISVVSDPVVITGINVPTPISIEGGGGSYSIGCTGTFTTLPGVINNGETVCLRLWSGFAGNRLKQTFLTVGGVVESWTIITDSLTPSSDYFDHQVNVVEGATVVSNTITLQLESRTYVEVIGGEYSINCTGTFTNEPTHSVASDAQVCVRHVNAGATSTLLLLSAATYPGDFVFTSTTGSTVDVQPDSISDFADFTDLQPSELVTSAARTVTGINAPALIFFPLFGTSSYEYSIGCTSTWTSELGFISNGQDFCVRGRASSYYGAQRSVYTRVGEPTEWVWLKTWTVPKPDPFQFIDVTDVTLGATVTSNTVPITGFTGSRPISVVAGEYSINCTEPFTSDPGTINEGESVCVRHVSTGGDSTILDIARQTDVFTSVTGPTIDLTPDAFTLIDVGDVVVGDIVRSNEVTITGINAPTLISTSKGRYSIGCFAEGEWEVPTRGNPPGLIGPGETVCVQHQASNYHSDYTIQTLTVGGVSDDFEAYTYGLLEDGVDTQPGQFYFEDLPNVTPATMVTSAPVTIGGIEAPALITVIGGEYSIGCTTSFTAQAGTIENGQVACVRHNSASAPATETHTILKVTGIDDRFTSTTFADTDGDGIPDSVEIDNGLNPNLASDALDDADGDGRSNLDEFLDGGQITVADTGDVNGDQTVDITDLLLMQQHLAGPPNLDTLAISRSDYNRNGALDLHDLLSLQQLLTGQ